jgi:NTP pyrophosphatase (non-canonical NTP hydrolase)
VQRRTARWRKVVEQNMPAMLIGSSSDGGGDLMPAEHLVANPQHLQPYSPDDFTADAMRSALPTSQNITYMLLGLGNEAGEVQGKLKKVLRGDMTLEQATPAIAKELGDVAWYLAGACHVLGVSLTDVMQANIAKLQGRIERGTLQGNGDDR